MPRTARRTQRRPGVGRSSGATDFRAIVECLVSAHYRADEIIEYLERAFGLAADEAAEVVRAVSSG